jgi:formylglycine-generating enzyme required for sulfatase activity
MLNFEFKNIASILSMFLPHFIRLVVLSLPLWLAISGLGNAQPTSPPAGASPEEELTFWEEQAFWEAIKDSQNAADFENYLKVYPNGRFVVLARTRIKALKRPAATDTRTSPAPTQKETKPSSATSQPSANTQPRSSPSITAARETFRDCPECPQMVVIPPGRFTMGATDQRPEERPAHTVTIASPFAIGVFEITVGEWDTCLREGGCKYSLDNKYGSDKQLPMSNVSWEDAQEYTHWLSQKTGGNYRLPSEAEWEYAARGGTSTPYWWGDRAKGTNQANCKDCGSRWDDRGPAPVGSFQANPFGLYDVHGNVWEWVADCWNRSYSGAPDDGSAWVRGDCIGRMQRGGAWKLDTEYMRVSRRGRYDRDVRYDLNGFRVAKTLR